MSNTLSQIDELRDHQHAIESLNADIQALKSKYVQGVSVRVNIDTRDFTDKGANGAYAMPQDVVLYFLEGQKSRHEKAVKRILTTLASANGLTNAPVIDTTDDGPF